VGVLFEVRPGISFSLLVNVVLFAKYLFIVCGYNMFSVMVGDDPPRDGDGIWTPVYTAATYHGVLII
jgi:hypothetical protein